MIVARFITSLIYIYSKFLFVLSFLNTCIWPSLQNELENGIQVKPLVE